MAKPAVFCFAFLLIMGLAGVALCETTYQDKQAQVGSENWDAWRNQQKSITITKIDCECPKPKYPGCPTGFKKIDGMLLEDMAIVDKWGDTTMYQGSMLEINTRMCADQAPAICKRWDACSNCKPQ